MSNTQVTQEKSNTRSAELYMSYELANKEWKLCFGDGSKERYRGIGAGDLERLEEEISKAKKRFGLPDDARVVSCYEAGRDGFWLHRYLSEKGIENFVVDPASIEVNRRKRRAKTDRLDGKKLLRQLLRYCGGEKKALSVVRVPGVMEEDERHLHRELETLKKERNIHCNRIRSFLILHGVRNFSPMRKDFDQYLELVRLWDGSALPPEIKERAKRERERLSMVQDQLVALVKKRTGILRSGESDSAKRVKQLMSLKAIGVETAWKYEKEFGWRKFRNRREVGNLAGLCGTPYDSGDSSREQGISKAGNRRIRSMMVEIGDLDPVSARKQANAMV